MVPERTGRFDPAFYGSVRATVKGDTQAAGVPLSWPSGRNTFPDNGGLLPAGVGQAGGIVHVRMENGLIVQMLLAGSAIGLTGWFSHRYAWWRPAVDWRHPRVLMYHMVSEHRDGARFNKLRVRPVEFERQLDWLDRHDFTFVFASQLYSDDPLPERTVCITFDDGYEDNLTAADPVLARHNARATLYLVTDRSQGWSSRKKAHHSDDELLSEPKLSDDQVRALLNTGRWELGGHTETHANLCAVDDSAAQAEITGARDGFPERFGVVPETFAYPFGLYGPQHVEMVADAGFSGAVTTDAGISDWPLRRPFETRRIKVSGQDGLLAFILRMRGGRRGLRS